MTESCIHINHEKKRVIPYREDIDILRALSVAAVVLFHIWPQTFQLGYLGVDIFFVISGYLVTRIILRQIREGNFSFATFYRKRILRLQPAAFFMLAVVMAFACCVPLPGVIADSTLKHIVYASAFLSNIRAENVAADYWAGGEHVALLHTWSLSVEEQFYLLLPILLVTFTLLRKPTLVILCVSSAYLACVGFAAGSMLGNHEYYYSTLARAAQLGMGCIVATLDPDKFGKGCKQAMNILYVLAWVLAAACLLPVTFTGHVIGKDLSFWLIPLATCFILVSVPSKFPDCPGMVRPALLYVGKASYSIYLWHWPAIVFANLYSLLFPSEIVAIIAIATGAFAVLVSYHLVERMGRAVRFPFVFFLVGTLIIGGGSLLMVSGSPRRLDNLDFATTWHGNYYDVVASAKTPRWQGIDYVVRQDAAPVERSGFKVRPEMKTGAILLGDSHACMWARFVDGAMESRQLGFISFAANGLGLFEDSDHRMSDEDILALRNSALEAIRRQKPEFVVIASAWRGYDNPAAIARLEGLIVKIQTESPVSKIVLIGDPPVLPIGNIMLPDFHEFAKRNNTQIPPLALKLDEASESAHARIRELCRLHSASYVDIAAQFPARMTPIAHGKGLYTDDDHLSTEGAQLFSVPLAEALSATASTTR